MSVNSTGCYVLPVADAAGLTEIAQRDDVRKRSAQICEALGEPGLVLLGVDRLDYTKGILHRLRAYGELVADHPIDWTRWQVVNCYMGRASLINSGGDSKGQSDLEQAVRTAVVNKRAGGSGLISGRKTFQRPMREGVELFHAIQDVFLCPEVTIA